MKHRNNWRCRSVPCFLFAIFPLAYCNARVHALVNTLSLIDTPTGRINGPIIRREMFCCLCKLFSSTKSSFLPPGLCETYAIWYRGGRRSRPLLILKQFETWVSCINSNWLYNYTEALHRTYVPVAQMEKRRPKFFRVISRKHLTQILVRTCSVENPPLRTGWRMQLGTTPLIRVAAMHEAAPSFTPHSNTVLFRLSSFSQEVYI